ncbi:hypothetical protein [Fischerella sp. PCC 9605]|nr:hypothetical protein [Fischerella sp. PCC 9605]
MPLNSVGSRTLQPRRLLGIYNGGNFPRRALPPQPHASWETGSKAL